MNSATREAELYETQRAFLFLMRFQVVLLALVLWSL